MSVKKPSFLGFTCPVALSNPKAAWILLKMSFLAMRYPRVGRCDDDPPSLSALETIV